MAPFALGRYVSPTLGGTTTALLFPEEIRRSATSLANSEVRGSVYVGVGRVIVCVAREVDTCGDTVKSAREWSRIKTIRRR